MNKLIILMGLSVLLLSSCGHSPKESSLYLPKIDEFIKDGKPTQKLTKLSVMQSLVENGKTIFTIVSDKKQSSQDFSYLLFQNGQAIRPTEKLAASKIATPENLPYSLDQVTLNLPESEQDYDLAILNKKSQVLDWRTFKIVDLSKMKNARFAIASCMDDSYSVQQQMWTELVNKNPQVLLMIGDNVYADKGIGALKEAADPQDLWKRYFETRTKLEIFKVTKLIPTLATWDDHDYGKNNSDKNYPFKNEAAEIFRSFFPHYFSTNMSKGPGISYQINIAGQSLYFLDMRSFRDSELNKEGDHLGAEQRQWLFSQLQKEKQPVWLISGDQFFGQYHPFESFQGLHPIQFSTFLQELKKVKAPFIFLSGDRHLTELMEIPESLTGKKSYELTSSGIHARVSIGNFIKHQNPLKIAGAEGTYNYMMVATDKKNQLWELQIQSFGPSNNLLFEKKIEIPLIIKK